MRTSREIWRESGRVMRRSRDRAGQRALCTWIWVFPDTAVCCFGLWGWNPALAPTAGIYCRHQSLYLVNAAEAPATVRAFSSSRPLICPVHPPPWMTTAVAARIFLWKTMQMLMFAKTPAHSLLPPSTHTQWLQRWSRRQWEIGPEMLSPQGPRVLRVWLLLFLQKLESAYDGNKGNVVVVDV